MDWGFLDIFKKADFNTLMLSVAIAGWILYCIGRYTEYSLIAALITSVYCVIRVIVYFYQRIMSNIEVEKYEAQKRREQETKEKAYEDNRRVEITRMFEGLTDPNKCILASILLNGKKDSYSCNVFHFPRYGKDASNIFMAQEISKIYRTGYGSGDYCISTRDYTDTITVTIDPILYGLIENHINKSKTS